MYIVALGYEHIKMEYTFIIDIHFYGWTKRVLYTQYYYDATRYGGVSSFVFFFCLLYFVCAHAFHDGVCA